MNTHNLQNFAPELRMFPLAGGDHGADVAITFDSLSPLDKTRESRTVQIPGNFGVLSFRLEGFVDPVDTGDVRVLVGRIILTTRDHRQNVDESYELANCTFSFRAKGRASKSGAFTHVSPWTVAEAVRQGVADALTAAVGDYYESRSRSWTSEVAVTTPAPTRQAAMGRPRAYRASNDGGDQRLKRGMVAAMVALPLASIIFVLALRNQSTSTALNDAVASTMAGDPQAVQAQVALTQETLKSMGLDPGAANDIGCLATP